jgi:hypothetical protein
VLIFGECLLTAKYGINTIPDPKSKVPVYRRSGLSRAGGCISKKKRYKYTSFKYSADIFCDPFNFFKAAFIGLEYNFFQLPSYCLAYLALPLIHVAEYTLKNPHSPISFILLNLLNGTHSRHDGPNIIIS